MNMEKSKKGKEPGRKQITTKLDSEKYQALRAMHEETDVPMSKLLDRAIGLLIEQHKNK